jgi:hypothetical protein
MGAYSAERNRRARATLSEDLKLAHDLGIGGTPSYAVGENVVVGAVGVAMLKERIEAAPRRPLDQGGWSAISSFRRPVQSPYCNGAGSPAWGVARGAGSSLTSLEELLGLHHLNPVTMFRTAPQGLSKQAEGRT